MNLSEIGKGAQELAKGIDSGRQLLDQVGNLGNLVQGQFDGLQGTLEEGFKGAIDNVQLSMEGWLLSSKMLTDLDHLFGGASELVAGFSSIIGAMTGQGVENTPQTISGLLTQNLLGNKLIETLSNPNAGPILERMEKEHPGYLFRLCMESPGIQNLANIAVGTTIRVLYQEGKSKQLVDFIDSNLSLSQALPDPAITHITVKKRGQSETEEYTRFFENNKYLFRKIKDGKPDAQGDILALKDIAEFTVKAKDTSSTPAKLAEQKAADSHTKVEEGLSTPIPPEEYADYHKDKVKQLMESYTKLTPEGKTAQGKESGAARTARLLAEIAWNKFDVSKAKAHTENTSKTPEQLMDAAIPKLIKDKQLVPGTIFVVRQDPNVDDAQTTHWFTFVGYIKKDGAEVPYFVDNFGYGDIKHMNHAVKDMRYFHKAFVPSATQSTKES